MQTFDIENSAVGTYQLGRAGLISTLLRIQRHEESALLYEVDRQLKRMGLADATHVLAGALPLGQQRMLEVARALASEPVFLLLEEPAEGLRHGEQQELAKLLKSLHDEGMRVLLVEHDMPFVMGLADRILVQSFGKKLLRVQPVKSKVIPPFAMLIWESRHDHKATTGSKKPYRSIWVGGGSSRHPFDCSSRFHRHSHWSRASWRARCRGGERQMLAIGLALMGKPRLLLLDEPSLGLAPLIVADIFRVVSELRDSGVSVLLVEQNARAALAIADYGYVLEAGRIVNQGPAKELACDTKLIEAYLGTEN